MPRMRARLPSSSTPQPSWCSAVSMTWVSSEASRSNSSVLPAHSADSSSTRLEMLLEPGNCTVPWAWVNAGRSRKAVEYMGLAWAGQGSAGG